jgi:N-acetyl-anhydromuramyl-L-alanine amidase AmpD
MTNQTPHKAVPTAYPRAKLVPAARSNMGGTLVSSQVRLFVVHVAQGSSQSGIDSWFKNPDAKVSAHFSVSRLGVVHQHVGLHTVAWAEENYNDVAISIEHLGYSGNKLTRLQLRASLALLTWLHEQFPQVPLRRTGNPSAHGIIGHGELGVTGGNHPDCPGWPILAQFNVALRTPRVGAHRWRRPFLG